MQFRDFIYHVSPLLQNNGFNITETSQGYVRFESSAAVITCSFDPRERQYYVHAGVSKAELYELDPLNLKQVFGFDTGELHPAEYFIKFFQQKDNPILLGDVQSLEALKRFVLQRSQEMMERIWRDQHLKAVDEAWKRKDYRAIIDSISKLDFAKLQDSVKKKYRIALAKADKQ